MGLSATRKKKIFDRDSRDKKTTENSRGLRILRFLLFFDLFNAWLLRKGPIPVILVPSKEQIEYRRGSLKIRNLDLEVVLQLLTPVSQVDRASARWLFWNFMAYPFLGEEIYTSPPRWL